MKQTTSVKPAAPAANAVPATQKQQSQTDSGGDDSSKENKESSNTEDQSKSSKKKGPYHLLQKRFVFVYCFSNIKFNVYSTYLKLSPGNGNLGQKLYLHFPICILLCLLK